MIFSIAPHCSVSFVRLALMGRRSQAVRQRSAKPLFIGSIPIAASTNTLEKVAKEKGFQTGTGR
jgi:hypothetical protein